MKKHSNCIDLLDSLVRAYGPCGQEDEVRAICQHEFNSLADEVWTDAAGNLIAKVNTKTSNPAIRVMTHMDEISMIVKRVEEDGSLKINPLGGMHPSCFGQGPVEILGDRETITGILSFGSMHTSRESASIHKIKPKELGGDGLALSFNDLHITTRKSASELVKAGVHPGTRVVIGKSRRGLCLFQDAIASFFLDNRAAIAIAIDSLRKIKERKLSLAQDLYIVASVAEEIGGHGACYAARTLPGDITVALDVGPVAKEYQTSLNAEPIIVYQDSITTYDKSICDQLVASGKKLGLNPQSSIFERFGSDASLAQNRGQSARSALVCFPTENTHGYEIIHKDVLENCSELLTSFLSK